MPGAVRYQGSAKGRALRRRKQTRYAATPNGQASTYRTRDKERRTRQLEWRARVVEQLAAIEAMIRQFELEEEMRYGQ